VLEASFTGIDNSAEFDSVLAVCNIKVQPQQYASSGSGTVYVDEIKFNDTDTDLFPVGGTNAFRLLGTANDSTILYLTGLKDQATLQLYRYALDDLSEDATIPTFGATTDSELDALTTELKPIVRPGSDGILFMFGRDGDQYQLQVSTDSGAAWLDISDAAWASDKVCIDLAINPLDPSDLLATFTDNDLYRSVDGGQTWVKTGDAAGTLRRAARYPTRPGELLLAAQAADTAYFTPNAGASFEDVSDTIGTINAIEVSR
jgi:hypothetical protein